MSNFSDFRTILSPNSVTIRKSAIYDTCRVYAMRATKKPKEGNIYTNTPNFADMQKVSYELTKDFSNPNSKMIFSVSLFNNRDDGIRNIDFWYDLETKEIFRKKHLYVNLTKQRVYCAIPIHYTLHTSNIELIDHAIAEYIRIGKHEI